MAKSKEMAKVVEAEFEETDEGNETLPAPPVVLSLPGGAPVADTAPVARKPQAALGGSIYVPAHRNLYDHSH